MTRRYTKNPNKPWVAPGKQAISKCKSCNHPAVAEINLGFCMKLHDTNSFKGRYGIHYGSAYNHYQNHVSPADKAMLYASARSSEAVKLIESDKTDVISTLQRLSGEAEEFLKRAKDNDDLRGGIQVIAELRRQVELTAKLLADQKGANDVILSDNPAWLSVRHIIMSVLNNHPSAKAEFLQKVGTLALGAP